MSGEAKHRRSRSPATDRWRPWRLPLVWAAAFGALVVAEAVLLWRLPEPGPPAVGLGALALGALMGLAWTLGAGRARDPLASLFTAAAEANPEARLITDADGAFLYANPAFHRLFFLATSLDAVADSLEGEEAAQEFARLRASARAGCADHAEVPLRAGSATTEWRRISVLPLPGGEGRVLWRGEDVTARRELETSRRQQEEMLADLLDHLPAGFYSADAAGRFLYVNDTLAAWLGMPGDALRDKGVKVRDFVISETDSAAAQPTRHAEVTVRKRDGSMFRASLLQAVRRDADDRVLYSRALLVRDAVLRSGKAGDVSAQRLHWLFDEAPVGIVLLDLNGDVTDCNRAFLKLLGLHRDAVVGRPLTERVSKEDRGDVGAQLSKVVMGATRAAHLEVRMPGAGERELVASLYASRIEDAGGEVSGLVLHFIDTTEQKHLEVQFAQAQKMQAVGQLAGGVAHDFNNLLTAMNGFCDLLLERHGPEDPAFSDIMQIKQNANRATNLVRQLLAFSRQQTFKAERLDPIDALADLSSMLGRLIGEKIRLDMDFDRDLGPIEVDRWQFGQVIMNLAVNARDAMPGGGTLTIRATNVAVESPAQRGHEVLPAGAYVLIEVIDTGSGIAKEDIGRIFEPFFSTKDVGEGTGLGLSTVYGIVHQSGGFIFVDSAPGEGTTFSLYLPRVMAEADEGTQPAAAEAPAEIGDLTGEGTVLLVEDEDAVRRFGARALRNKGYRVLEADNGEAALDVLNATDKPVDLIISDVIMPGMDGHTLVRLIRQEMPGLKAILMSGYAEEALSGQIERDPTIHFLAKPFTLKDMAGKVKEVLSEKPAKRAGG